MPITEGLLDKNGISQLGDLKKKHTAIIVELPTIVQIERLKQKQSDDPDSDCDRIWPKSWRQTKKEVFDRDKGICADCGLDTIAAYEAAGPRPSVTRDPNGFRIWGKYMEDNLGIIGHYKIIKSSAWSVDHIEPKVLGGTNDMSNLRTLCLPCHRNATAEHDRLREYNLTRRQVKLRGL